MQIAEYIMAKRSDKLAIQSSASIPRARARIHTLMPETTAARKLRTTHTVTMVRHSEAASTSGVAFTTQGIAAVFRFCGSCLSRGSRASPDGGGGEQEQGEWFPFTELSREG